MLARKIGLILSNPELIQQVRKDILTLEGYQVIEIDDEPEKHSPHTMKDIDLVILEVPGLEKDDLVRVASFVKLDPMVPIVVIYKEGSASKLVEAFRLGVADCLGLPLQGEELSGTINRSLDRWGWLKSNSNETKETEEDTFLLDRPGKVRTDLKVVFAILNSATDGIIILDKDNRLLFINESAKLILDLNDRELTELPFSRGDAQPDLVEMVNRISKANLQRDEITMNNGRVYNTQLSYNPGRGSIIIMQDISHLKDLDRIKSDFVATVSHDLRSPLTAILGYTELIDRVGTINDQQREFIRRIQFSTYNITSLINDLLDLGKIEAGFDTQKELVSLNAIVRYALEGLRSRIDEKKQNIRLELEDQIPNFLANPIRLKQMAGNLIGNAVKYTPPGGYIWVRVFSEDGMLIFQVQDTGPGIQSQDQPYIFNKFYRGSNFPSDTPGTGLGLAIVKSIAENHQGRVWVESNPGNGSTFTVVLPVTEQT
jgi:signal transduction histidine kinase